MDPLFAERDLRLIEALEYDPALGPAFDEMKACLVWADERPSGLTSDGYETLCDLWIIRSYIHRGIPREEWGIEPASGYFQDVWARVQAERIQWPGFERMTLSQRDREYLESCLREASEPVSPVRSTKLDAKMPASSTSGSSGGRSDSLISMLHKVKERPSMYLGGNDSAEQLRNLQWVILGYQYALRQLAPDHPSRSLFFDFGKYLYERFHWSAAEGPIAAIERSHGSPEEAWAAFWKLLDEFVAYRSART